MQSASSKESKSSVEYSGLFKFTPRHTWGRRSNHLHSKMLRIFRLSSDLEIRIQCTLSNLKPTFPIHTFAFAVPSIFFPQYRIGYRKDLQRSIISWYTSSLKYILDTGIRKCRDFRYGLLDFDELTVR